MRKGLRRFPEVILGGCLLIAAVRLLVRDRYPLLSTLMYAASPIVLAVLASAGAAGALALRRPRWAAGGAVLALAFAGWFLGASRFCNPAEAGGDLRVLLWNVSRGSRGWDKVAAHVREAAPDLAVFVEGGQARVERDRFLQELLPGADHRWLSGGMGIAVRGKILETSDHRLGDGGRAALARVTLGPRKMTVVVVDFWADPWRHRREAFEALGDLLEPLKSEPLLVVGDFNTPRDSFFFDRLRAEFGHAFESAGRGFDGTWPEPLPVLAIDHVWFGPGWKIRDCRLQGSEASDHRSVTAVFGP